MWLGNQTILKKSFLFLKAYQVQKVEIIKKNKKLSAVPPSILTKIDHSLTGSIFSIRNKNIKKM